MLGASLGWRATACEFGVEMFRIEFITAPYWADARNEQVLRGRLTLGAFAEEFESSLAFWAQSDYEEHWLRAARRLDTGQPTSAFITDCYDPATANFIVWWPVWRECESLVFQNALLFLAELESAFNAQEPAEHVPQRVMLSEDGASISEWVIGSRSVSEWLRARTAAQRPGRASS